MENVHGNKENDEIEKSGLKDSEKEVEKNEGGYLGYYLFIALSAIIGFVVVYYLTQYGIKLGNEKGITNIKTHQVETSILVALISVIVFLFITIIFKKFWKKIVFTEFFLYLYIGFLTTVISILVFAHFNAMLNPSGKKGDLGWIVAEMLSFVIAASFAFICDKILVFKSLSFELKKVASEFGIFIGGRLATEGIAILIMYVLINVFGNNEIFAKLIVAIIVIVLNYLLSKFIIFKKETKSDTIVVEESKNEKIDK